MSHTHKQREKQGRAQRSVGLWDSHGLTCRGLQSKRGSCQVPGWSTGTGSLYPQLYPASHRPWEEGLTLGQEAELRRGRWPSRKLSLADAPSSGGREGTGRVIGGALFPELLRISR